MKVIFLDFDGVLNSEMFMNTVMGARMGEAEGVQHSQSEMLDVNAVSRLNRIIDETGALVVISTSWRVMFPMPAIEYWLMGKGFKGAIIGVTPSTAPDKPSSHLNRGYEIKTWLTNMGDVVQNYVVLDDCSDPELEAMGHHHVQTGWNDGLQDEHVDMAIAVLNS